MWSEKTKKNKVLKKDEILNLAANYCRWMDGSKANVIDFRLEIDEKPENDSDSYFFWVIADKIFTYGDGSNRIVSSVVVKRAKDMVIMFASEGIEPWILAGTVNPAYSPYIVPSVGKKDYTAELRELINKLK